MDKNNLGEYSSLQELWKAHPEGGHEGDYAIVNGVTYRWDKYNRIWNGSASPVESYGRRTEIHEGDVIVNNDLTVAGMLRAKGVKQPNKGLFKDLDALQKRYPLPEIGWWATVGDTVPGLIYRCDKTGVWSATGETGGLDAIDYEKIDTAVRNAQTAADKADKMANRANAEAGNANTMAALAQQAADSANESAGNADIAASNANSKAEAANTAAVNAASAGAFAKDQGDYAKEQGAILQQRVEAVEQFSETVRTEEQARADSEKLRIAEEEKRKSAEQVRTDNESGRVSAEQQRASEFATLKEASEEATSAANTAASEATSAAATANATTSAANKVNEDIVKAEQSRASAESLRTKAESTRVESENTRQQNESTRVGREYIREANETKRKSVESERVKAESDRESEETLRRNAETTRKSNESARTSSESSRAADESKRVSAETVRAAAESKRVISENSRVSAENTRASEFVRLKTESETATDNAVKAATRADTAATAAEKAASMEIVVDAETGIISVIKDKAKENKTIGRVPLSRHDYTDGATYYKDNIVTRYGSAFQCNVESTTTPPATLDASGKVMLGEGWIFFADASGVEDVKNGVAALERDLGQYAELPSVAMTAETTGKYINADGEFVDDADFNIAAIGAVVVGNTYELYMSSADKMKLGVALFVARIKTTTTSGTERIKYVPLFSAMSTDIPTSGYVCFEAMEAYSDVLVCYRADVPEAATLLVRRYGTKASIATQLKNLRNQVDLKSFADGYYESMRVGSADNLTSKGDATEEVIMSRRAGGDNQIEDGSASIKRIKGYSVVMNQLCKDKIQPVTLHGTTISCENDLWSIKGYSTGYPYYALSNAVLNEGHKYMLLEKKIKVKAVFSYRVINTNNRLETKDFQPNSVFSPLKNSNSIELALNPNVEYDELRKLKFFDLTTMFGSGNEPTTPDDFAKRLGYSSIDDVPYIPYNEGEIVSSFAEGIKTTDTEGKVSERKWSKTLKKYFPDGLKSAGSAFDEITPTKAVKRIGQVEFSGKDSEKWILHIKSSHTWKIHIQDYGLGVLRQSNAIYNWNMPTMEPEQIDKINGVYVNYSYYLIITCLEVSTLSQFKEKLKSTPFVLNAVLASPEENSYDELNLTEQVAEGGTEEAIITEGKTSTPLRADIVYPIDAYNTIKANKTNIGTLSSLSTASKTDLVSAINELAGKVGALEAKATESVTNETTE